MKLLASCLALLLLWSGTYCFGEEVVGTTELVEELMRNNEKQKTLIETLLWNEQMLRAQLNTLENSTNKIWELQKRENELQNEMMSYYKSYTEELRAEKTQSRIKEVIYAVLAGIVGYLAGRVW